uniref:Uncharacterized protein n=1 Tax=Arundo donax TaxID=35708 RepID=A0A0A9DUG2_ARUDO
MTSKGRMGLEMCQHNLNSSHQRGLMQINGVCLDLEKHFGPYAHIVRYDTSTTAIS